MDMRTTIGADWIWTGQELIRGVLEIENGTIVAIRPTTEEEADGPWLSGHLIAPGFVNAHSHAFQRAFRGHVQWRASDSDDFWSWRHTMYTVAGRLTPESVEALTRLAYVEMLEAGFSRVGEFHYLVNQANGQAYADRDELAHRVAQAAVDTGIRQTLLRVAYNRGGFKTPAAGAQLRFIDQTPEAVLESIERLRARWPQHVIGLAPHSVRAIPATWLDVFAGFDGPVHAHVAEQPAELAACREEYGCEPLDLFARAGLLNERFAAVHLTWPGPQDIDRLVAAGAFIAVCPTTELDLGDGFLPVDARRARMCIGTDSHARIDPFAEIRALELHARGLAGTRNVMAPDGSRHGLSQRLMTHGAREGALALGADEGQLAVGASADFVAMDLDRPAALGVPPLEAVIFHGSPDWVRKVWVGGELVVDDGRHVRRDELLAGVAEELAELL